MDEQLVLIDAGTGNLRSVQKALESLGGRVHVSSDPEVVRRGGKIVLPGVGAFGDFMHGLRQRWLVEPIREIVRWGKPLLGICVGMQALFDFGEELGEHPGLGLLPGRVIHFPILPGLKIPHTGWNELKFTGQPPLFQGIDPGEYAYFNHSYYCLPANPADRCVCTEYGIPFASAVQRENLYGLQFHPEKSQRIGLQVLANFLHLSL